ncbi:hypothetical protein BDZ45DRAFT_678476 [Acephala macrosclerotiorum]|nr:hypothetical protein BDZ45DRAFT_678476 [Acephala macrosclerotiorum]
MYTTSRLSFASLAMLASTVVLSSATLMSSRATTVNDFTYTSCQSASDFQDASLGFVSVANSTFMSVGYCTTQCAGNSDYAFAALYNTECFCGQHFTAISTGQDADCDTPCPGYPDDTCGGTQDAAKGVEWYSLYSNSGSSSSSDTTSSVSATNIPGTTVTSSTPVMGTSISSVSNVTVTTTTSTSSSSATSKASQVPVSGAGAGVVGAERVGLLVSLVGLLAFL